MSASREWEALRKELEALAEATRAFNVYVVDAWDNVWCAARWFDSVYPDDLAALVRAEVTRRGVSLQRGGKLDASVVGAKGHAYIRTYGSCYVLVLRFAGPFDSAATREAVVGVLPRLERLTLGLPPPDGPGSSGHEALGSA